jgi:hypothetical protein
MGYLTGINRINGYAFKVIPTTRFAEVSFLERLVDVYL